MGGGVLVRGGGLVSAAFLLAGAGGRREEQEDKIYLGHRWSVGRSTKGAREGRGLPFARRKDREWKGVVARR